MFLTASHAIEMLDAAIAVTRRFAGVLGSLRLVWAAAAGTSWTTVKKAASDASASRLRRRVQLAAA
jgi:hypothetical protein